MAQNAKKETSSIYESLQYNYDKVDFNPGTPPLHSELNILQEYLEILTQKSTASFPSGWLSFRPYYTSSDLANSFYTQDPEEPKPEVALVNGWPLYVTNTNTSLKHNNQINLNDLELKSGSRIDGVFLEVWRSLITPADSDNNSKPQNVSKVSTLYGIDMFDENLGWVVGDKGIILKTVDGGIIWSTKETPIAVKFNKVKFHDQSVGYAVGEKGYIIKTINGGESWFILPLIVNDNLNDIVILDQNTVIIIGDNGTILKTLDGTLFEIIKSTSGVTTNLNGIYFYDDRIGWIVGNKATMLITVDRGQSWQVQTVLDVRTNTVVSDDLVSVAFFNLDDGLIIGKNGTILKTSDGGYHFVDLSDRIWDGTSYKTIAQVRPYKDNTFNKIFIRKAFPYKIFISVYGGSQAPFKNLSYSVSPAEYPNSIVLRFRGSLDGKDYLHVLDLNDYASAEDLANDINSIMSPWDPADVSLPDDERAKVRVFIANVHYTSAPSDFRPVSGTISTTATTDITFSIEDKAWIVGNEGLVLKTSNSGSKWTVLQNSYGFDLYDIEFTRDNYGWVIGSDGSIFVYDPINIPDGFNIQDTDLPLKTKGRIYPEGNILSQAEDFLDDNIIDSNVGVETSSRVQIQYAIRISEGIDPFDFPEAGLGANYVYSLGPNQNTNDSGSYTYENMGSINGDYGSWRARCRNTYDGWSWAIPMFIVTRRNSSPFNPDTNINGSTIYAMNAIRPDGLTYEEITETDIMDLRKKINIQSFTAQYEKNIDKLLGNRLRTKLSILDEKGSQYGTSILLADTYTGTDALNKIVTGALTSEASLEFDEKVLDPGSNTPLTGDDWTIGPTINSLYMSDPSYHVVKSYLNEVETAKVIPGFFEGLGTNTIKFNIDTTYVPTTGEQYLMRVGRIDYSKDGLSKVPSQAEGIKYLSNTEANSIFYRGINTNDDSKVVEYLEERVPGYKDFTVMYSGVYFGDPTTDLNTFKSYNSEDIYNESSVGFRSSLLKFKGQQYRGSLMEYHYFYKSTDFINKLEIPKVINNYGVLNLKRVVNYSNGNEYLISNVWSSIQLPDTTYDNNSITINIDPSFAIPKDTVVEIVLEVVPASLDVDGLNVNTINAGPNIQAYRAPFTTNFNIGSKGVESLYKAVLYKVSITGGTTRSLTVDLTSLTPSTDLKDALILGIGSFHNRAKTFQSYIWYKTSTQSYYSTLPIDSVTDLGTSTITINLMSGSSLVDGSTVYVPMLVKQSKFYSATDVSKAYVFYKYCPYQTVENLPPELTVEILTSSDFIYASNLGTGGSNKIKKDPYENPIEHIAVNDPSIINDNVFTNLDDLNFTNIGVETGFVKIPAYISRKLGEDITFSLPNNIGDRLGRTYYTACTENFRFQGEGLVTAVPRKVFLPMIGRIRSDVIKPFIRGEIILIIFSKAFEARSENEVGFFDDSNVEYSPGYFEEAKTSISIYRMQNYPTVRV
jgi:photosystem II stability/assembly factor-like uncharacterized protein